jgi:hypothetical protein
MAVGATLVLAFTALLFPGITGSLAAAAVRKEP